MIIMLRSLLFDVFFYTFSIIYFITFYIPMRILPRRCTYILFRTWTNCVLRALSICVGLKHQVIGMDILEDAIKQGPCILAMKHQSAFETIFCSRLASHFVIVLKKQLTLIPVYRGYLQKLNSIVIDKDEGVASLRSLIKEGKNAIANGYSILIFPEGTRQTPGEMPDYKGGIGVLYKSLQVPVVPIALDTGVFWGRRAKFKHPGTITIQVLPVIPAGLEREVFMETLQTTINTTSRDLYEKSIKTVLNKKKTSFLT